MTRDPYNFDNNNHADRFDNLLKSYHNAEDCIEKAEEVKEKEMTNATDDDDAGEAEDSEEGGD